MKVKVMRGANYKRIHENLILAGVSVNCFVTGLGGEMLPKTGNQFAQLGRSLQMPYVFFGLGRTNNYVNQLTITIPFVFIILFRFLILFLTDNFGLQLFRILK